ncbi:hypothetical protein [Maridesulfovibrio sp.]|uniref:hypothetical protein n=1 Tax=Maridesulfovibrio sp. TaxID=2795000 RepID=UPI0039EFA068
MPEQVIATKTNDTTETAIHTAGEYVVDTWVDARTLKPLYCVCRNYGGAFFPLMSGFKPMSYELAYDACAAAEMLIEDEV